MPNTSVTPCATSVSTKASDGVMRVRPETTMRFTSAILVMGKSARKKVAPSFSYLLGRENERRHRGHQQQGELAKAQVVEAQERAGPRHQSPVVPRGERRGGPQRGLVQHARRPQHDDARRRARGD